MFYIAMKILMGDRAKFVGLILGITFTAFLVTFAASYFAGFMTRGFAIISENSSTDVWVMDPAVESVEQTINMPISILNRVRSTEGVRYAVPLTIGSVDARFPNGRIQSFQVIGVDDATLAGVPKLMDGSSPNLLRAPDAVIVDPGGTSGKLETPIRRIDQWPHQGVRLNVPTRELKAGDELLVNDRRIKVVGLSKTLPRFPPRPLIYTSYSNAVRILPQERTTLTYVMAFAQPGISGQQVAHSLQQQTGLRARSSEEFKADTVRWNLINSEDVGDMAAMLILAMTVGFGVTGVMLYMFTYENLTQYAVLKAMGTSQTMLLLMIFFQAGVCAFLGTGIGIGVCAVIGKFIVQLGYPFRMMWFTPLVGALGVLVISLIAAVISVRPVFKLDPGVVFAGR